MDKQKTVSRLLCALKDLDVERNKLEQFGINIQSMNDAGMTIFDCIKDVVGMPEEEKIGEWTSDYWLISIVEYSDGKITKEDVVNRFINWRSTKFDE